DSQSPDKQGLAWLADCDGVRRPGAGAVELALGTARHGAAALAPGAVPARHRWRDFPAGRGPPRPAGQGPVLRRLAGGPTPVFRLRDRLAVLGLPPIGAAPLGLGGRGWDGRGAVPHRPDLPRGVVVRRAHQQAAAERALVMQGTYFSFDGPDVRRIVAR